jgi:hypothetical protein
MCRWQPSWPDLQRVRVKAWRGAWVREVCNAPLFLDLCMHRLRARLAFYLHSAEGQEACSVLKQPAKQCAAASGEDWHGAVADKGKCCIGVLRMGHATPERRQ